MAANLYFAYGSNMDEGVMQRLCPGHRYLGAAELSGHRIAFTRRSLRTGTGVADILAAEGASVCGALYELDDVQLAAIDEKEGRGWAYERRSVRVRLLCDDSEHDALAYAVIVPDAEHVAPSDAYRERLINAARARELPRAYVEALVAQTASLA